MGHTVKLHLGCGQQYLKGYVNIDYAAPAHTVQEKSVADFHADILDLSYAECSIEEVRLHHVFEHFPRPVACALLSGWYSWLKPGGILQIEVPDLQKSARVLVGRFTSFKKRAIAERHLFGSHEAPWAVHCEGYTSELLTKMVESFGFNIAQMRTNSWRGTYNLELIASKSEEGLSLSEFTNNASNYLRHYLLDTGESETRLLAVWMETYRKQASKSWAKNG